MSDDSDGIAIGPSHPLVEDACVILHNAYEAAAIEHGWRTQTRSRKPWDDVPEANRATMRTAMTALLVYLGKGHVGQQPPGHRRCLQQPDEAL